MLNKRKAMAWATLGLVIGTTGIPFVAYADSIITKHSEQYTSMKNELRELRSDNASIRNDISELIIECEELIIKTEEQQISIDKLVATEKELTAKLKAIEVAKEESKRTIVAESMAGEIVEDLKPETTETPGTPKSNEWIEVKIEATFYTSLPEENGGEQYAGMNALGGKLHTGSLAVPKEIPLGTEFIIDGLPSAVGTNNFKADDRGGAIKMKGDTVRVDVFVARLNGESDSQYNKRVNDLGRVVTSGRYRLQ